jgi:hypothetical protein
MKRILILFLITLLLFACTKQSNIVNPEYQSEHVALDKKKSKSSGYDKTLYPAKVKKSRMIVSYQEFLDRNNYNAEKEVSVRARYQWKSGDYKGYRFDATIRIQGKDIDWNNGSKLITGSGTSKKLIFDISFDPKTLSADFAPSPFTFASPVSIDIRWKGLPSELVKELASSNDFGFLPLDGSKFESTQYASISFIRTQIRVTDAEIPHFSRYGFLR